MSTVFYLGIKSKERRSKIEVRPLSNKTESRLRQAKGPANFHLKLSLRLNTSFPLCSASFDYSELAITAFIELVIAETNQGYVNSDVPITIYPHCIIQSAVQDNLDLHVMIDDFKESAGNISASIASGPTRH